MASNVNGNVESQPKFISRDEADNLNDYAQDLNDKVTHIVDYGGVVEEPKPKRKK